MSLISIQKFLHVGGKGDYINESGLWANLKFEGKNIPLDLNRDLNDAIKAEVTIEKVLCHDRTKNLRISVNNHKEIVFLESEAIPEPQDLYAHHFYPTVEVPLNYFSSGNSNYFSLPVDTNIACPQNLIYGVIFRIYYKLPDTRKNLSVAVYYQDEVKIYLYLNGYDKDQTKLLLSLL